MCLKVFNKGRDEDPVQYTAKMIAFALIFVFFMGLIWTGVVSAFKDNADWFNLFKDGFLILAGAITTIIGYYFGSRRTDVVETNLRKATREKKKALKKKEISEKALARITSGSDGMEVATPSMMEVDHPDLLGITPAENGGS